MSDFDKEAERERLREKYEKDQKDRETTEKMSELLLQGATMTNAHCSECGDPIFRYDGQEFCATCEKAVDRDASEEADESGDTAADETADPGEQIEVTSPDESARVAFGGDGTEAQEPPADQSPETRGQESARQRQQDRVPDQPRQSDRQRSPTEHTREVPNVDPSAGGDVSAARESLVRTLTRFSEQAEATEDPQRAREHLAAAREAAEALAALRR